MAAKDNYHHGDLRQTILEEALIWIDQENIVSLSLRGIARRVGVSHNAPYRHFPDKESLLVAIAETGFKQLHQTLQQESINNLDNVQKRLENIGIAYVKYAIDHQAYYRVMISDYPRNYNQYPELAQASNNAFNVLLDVIEAGQAAKVFNAQDAQQLARVCWSLVHGIAMLAIDNQFMSYDRTSIMELAQIATKTVSKGISE